MECCIVVIVNIIKGEQKRIRQHVSLIVIPWLGEWGIFVENYGNGNPGWCFCWSKFHQFAFINNKLLSKLEERLINMASGAQRAGADISISASKHKTWWAAGEGYQFCLTLPSLCLCQNCLNWIEDWGWRLFVQNIVSFNILWILIWPTKLASLLVRAWVRLRYRERVNRGLNRNFRHQIFEDNAVSFRLMSIFRG